MSMFIGTNGSVMFFEVHSKLQAYLIMLQITFLTNVPNLQLITGGGIRLPVKLYFYILFIYFFFYFSQGP